LISLPKSCLYTAGATDLSNKSDTLSIERIFYNIADRVEKKRFD